LLEVLINGNTTNQIGEFTRHNGAVYARPQDLASFGFRFQNLHLQTAGSVAGKVLLSDLPGFRYTVDERKQQILILAANAILTPNLVKPAEQEGKQAHRTIESGTGLTLNYDATGNFTNQGSGGTGSLELRAFAPSGLLSATMLAYQGSSLVAGSTKPVVRLDQAWSRADVNTLRRTTVGDFINGGLSWNRSIHMEGVQMRSDFSMRPDLITFPLPTITGSAAVPSTLDVLVNGNLVTSNDVSAGPFEVPQLPVISGAGTITMTLTNTLGQQVSVTQSFYGGSQLLAPGLQTFAGQVGLVRRNWGSVSNSYGKLAATGYYRRGLSQTLTAEGSVEATSGLMMAGGGVATTLWNRAMLNLDAAASGGNAGSGGLLSVGVQHIGRVFNLGGAATLTTPNFRDVAARNGSAVERKQISGFTGLALRRFGTIGVAYAGVNQDPPPLQTVALGSSALKSHIVTANYSLQFHHASFFATEFRSLDAGGTSGLQLGLTYAFGKRSSTSLSGSSSGSMQIQAQQTPVHIGDFGYSGYVQTGNSQHQFGVGQWKSPAGLLSAGVDHATDLTTLRLEAQGSLSMIDHGVFPSNTIYDSFAVIDTDPLPHVRIYQENRDVGRTDRKGRLLVPDMRAFDVNHIALEPRDVPADASLVTDKKSVRPQDRSGVVVRFSIHFSRSALLRLTDAAGKPLPLGSMATLKTTGVVAPIGYDGEVYLEELLEQNQLDVTVKGGQHCSASFRYRPIPGDIPSLGPIRCLQVKP